MKKIGVALLLAVVVAVVLASMAFARVEGKREFGAVLAPLNGSGASGEAELKLKGTRLKARIESEGLSPNLGHLQHIHGLAQGISECPTLAADVDPPGGDGLISFVEGLPFYGPVQASFTTTGDTSPASAGALERFPVADAEGAFKYSRKFRIPADAAARLGGFVIVQHGVDLNGDHMYNGPAELTLPATCGRILPR